MDLADPALMLVLVPAALLLPGSVLMLILLMGLVRVTLRARRQRKGTEDGR